VENQPSQHFRKKEPEKKIMTRISFDLNPELHQQFKLYCAENKCSITDKITEYIKQTIETPKAETNTQVESDENPSNSKEKEQEIITVNGKEYVYDLDKPISPETRIATLEKAVQDSNESLKGIVNLQENIQTSFTSKLAEVNQALKQLEKKLSEANQKFVISGKLIESVMSAVEETTSAKKCEDDVKGIAILKGNPV
jgi:hypothetical protein